MPNRIIRDSLLDSERYHACGIEARLLFVELLLCADDYGLVPINDTYLRRHTTVCDGKNVAQLTGFLQQLMDQGLIHPYDSQGGGRFAAIPRFGNSPRAKKPKWPLPPMPILNEMNGVGQKCIASALHLRANAPETVTETVTVTETDKPPVREMLPGIEPPAKAPDPIPDTPHQAIVDAYHRVLPELPRIRDWHANRQANLRVLWKRIATKKRWPSQAEGVDFFARYFAYVRTCPLLMGTVPGKAWSADLEWLTKTGNYTKVIEGKYLP